MLVDRLPPADDADDVSQEFREKLSDDAGGLVEQLFHQEAQRLFALLRVKGMASDDAEEIVQEAMLALYRRAGDGLAGLRHPKTYLYTIALNLATRYHVVGGRHETRELEPSLFSDNREPSDALPGALVVREALAQIPRRQREVFFLRYIADLSLHETSRILGISEHTTRTHAERAIDALRKVVHRD